MYTNLTETNLTETNLSKNNAINSEKILYSVKDLKTVLSLGEATIYQLLHAGLLPYLNLGGAKVRKAAVEEFVAKYEGYDLSDINNIKPLTNSNGVTNRI